MASRPPDFKASGLRVERIIASGSDTNPKLYIIGKDAAGNDGITVDTSDLILSGDGTDTWLFISGGIGNNNRVTFGGDVYISGSLTAASGGGTSPGGATTEVQFNNAGSFSGSSGLRYIASTQTLVVANLTVTGTSTIVTSSNLVISDPLIYLASGSTSSNQNGGIAIASGSSVTNQSLVFGRVANDVWGVGRQDVVGGTSTSLTGMTHVPLRASAIQLGGSVAVITSSDGTTVTASGSSVQLKGNDTDGIKFYENGTEYLKFTMNAGSSALINATESAYPSLYLSGAAVHLDSSDGLTWFGAYGSERLAVDHSDSSKPQLVARFPSGQAVNLILSGSSTFIGSNDGTTTFNKGTASYLKAAYNGVNDVTVSAQTYNVNFGSQGIAALSGSSVTLNSTGGVFLQRDSVNFAAFGSDKINTSLSSSNSIFVKPGASGSLYVSGSTFISNNAVVSGALTASYGVQLGRIGLTNAALTTTAGTVDILPEFATNLTIGTNSRNITIADQVTSTALVFDLGKNSQGATTLNLGTGGTFNNTKTINLGTGGTGLNATTNVNIGAANPPSNAGGTTTINSTLTDVKYVMFVTGVLVAPKISGSLTRLADGTPYLIAGTNITLSTGSSGAITINSSGGGGSSNWNELSPSPRLNTTASVALAGNLGSSYAAQSEGSNTYFFVSGSIGSAPSISSTGISLFGGDVATSGSIHLVTGSYQSTISLVGTATSASLEIRNMTLGGSVLHSVKTSTNNTVNFLEVLPNGSQENTKIALMRTAYAGSTAINPYKASDTNFFVGGLAGSKGGATGGTSVFGGDLMISGSSYVGTSTTDKLNVRASLASSIVPDTDRVYDLGSSTLRFANIYTGDLHLKNDRGDYTLIEEEDCLTIRFNKTGKRYKFVLEPAPEYDD